MECSKGDRMYYVSVAPTLSLSTAGSEEANCCDCHSCEKMASVPSLQAPWEEAQAGSVKP